MMKFFKSLLPAVVILFQGWSCNAQEKSTKIHWLSFEDAVRKSDSIPRKLFIDVYTDWCGWCKRMDASTFMNDSVAAYLNRNFYPVKLDAEQRDTIFFRDRVFAYKPEYKVNEIAIALLNGQLSYPSYILLDEKFSILTNLKGYQTPDQLMPALNFFAEDIYKHQKHCKQC